MRNFRRFRLAGSLVLCLAFTGGGVAWAEDATPDFYIEDPYAPHKTWGSEARIGSAVGFIYDGPADDPAAREKWLSDGGRKALIDARTALEATEPFDTEHIEKALRGVVQARDAKPKDVFQPVRVALAGTTVSPGIFETLEVLGRDESLARIDAALRT